MTKEYYSLKPALSRGAILTLVIGERSAGKTYASKEWALRDFKATKAQCMYMRRNTEETVISKGTLWDDIAYKFGYEVKVKGNLAKIRNIKPENMDKEENKEWENENPWEDFCYYASLSEAQSYKGFTATRINKIIFDEFIIENTRRKYIPNEPNHLLGIAHSIFRDRAVRIVCLSNSGYISNPYFQAYNIKSEEFENSSFIKRNNGAVLFEYYNSNVTDEDIAQNDIAKISTDSYKEYAFKNKFKDGGAEMINIKPARAEPFMKITTDGSKWLTFYKSPGKPWWLGEANPKISKAYSLDKSKPIPKAIYSEDSIKILKRKFNSRQISFESADVRSMFLDWINY